MNDHPGIVGAHTGSPPRRGGVARSAGVVNIGVIMKFRLILGILLVIAVCAVAVQSQTPKTYKVVFDIGEGGDEYFEKVIQKIANLSRDSRLAGKLDIRIVAHSPGIDFVATAKNQPNAQSIELLIRSGVTIEACNNSILGHKMTAKDLFGGVKVVESGIGELVLLQNQGYAYFKP